MSKPETQPPFSLKMKMAESPSKDTRSVSNKKGPCPWLCDLVPSNLPPPGPAQTVLHPRKDVFVLKLLLWNPHNLTITLIKLKVNQCHIYRVFLVRCQAATVAKVGPTGDRRCKMELELVTPKGPEKKPPCRIDTRETQCEPDPPPCTCCTKPRKKGRS
ncbi:unnamed protein product [Spodoptera littoralis]|uniref:Uncharacterized protein n=1 Tax=Spodoptera littoralis TaxID=7109 RepID=A0A9P0IME9_SPOLI|nr:unnamed protein product [Spodoptera littoralis]CAH1647663.1 unnamed protein product [Spodoptera littoralis]